MTATSKARSARGWLLAAALVLAGCGRSGPATFPVSGTVTYNGAPVHEGSIIFLSADKRVAADAGKIADGRFVLAAKPGKKKVEIRAVREVGEVIPSMGVKARQSYIPAEFNVETTLTAEVLPRGDNQFAFELNGPP